MIANTAIKKGYKQTELGVIPDDWDVKIFSELGSFYKGKGISSKDLVTDGLPCIMYGDIYVKFETKFSNPDFRITKQTAAKSSLAKTGDLFFTGSGETAEEIGKCVVYQGRDDIYIGGDIIAFTPNPDTDSLFLAYMQYSKMLLSQKANLGQGYTVVHIYTEHIKSLKAPIPPTKPEQTAIATVLSDTDALIEHLEKLIAKKKAIKQGTMQQLLTGKKRLPGFSGEWVEEKLRDIADFVKGRGLSKNKIVNDGTYSCILYGELFTTYTQVIKEVKSKTNTRDGLLSIEGDILMPGSTTTVGIDLATASALQQSDILLGGDIIVIRKKESNKYDSEFLAKHLTHISKYKIAEITQGITIIHLHGSRLKEIYVKMPNDRNEQTAIATILSDMDAEIESLEEKRDKYTMLKQGMMQQLLTGKIRIYANN